VANLNVIRVQWTGLIGMPGVSTFFCTGDPSFLLAKLKTFYTAIANYVPSGITWTFPGSGIVIDSSTGQAVSSWASTAPAPGTSGATGGFSAPGGAVINWRTGFFVGGRELRGRTFIVPINGTNYDSTGRLVSGCVNALSNAANAVPGGGNPLVVYGRATASNAPVTSASVPSKVVVLRSRRD
jgi:hypothetical protein